MNRTENNKTRCKAKPPVCTISRLRPATHMHYSYHTLTPSTECHRNSVMWIKPTKIGCHGNVPWGIKLTSAWSSTVQPWKYDEYWSCRCVQTIYCIYISQCVGRNIWTLVNSIYRSVHTVQQRYQPSNWMSVFQMCFVFCWFFVPFLLIFLI